MAAFIALAHLCLVHAALAAAPVVTTTSGPVSGLDLGAVYAYLGVPFARAQRWGPPTPPAPWTSVLNASAYGAGCVQFAPRGSPLPPEQGEAEDCLTANVWVPRVHAQGRPMITWIHGGGFIGGSAAGSLALYAQATGAVVVALNYRLGSLGFLALAGMAPALPTPADPAAACANAGLLDQQAGLQWAAANAGAFGADPAHALLTGQSAGGSSVLFHLTLPGSYATYRAALAQSPGSPTNSLASGRATAAALAARVNCSAAALPAFAEQLACLRAVPAPALVAAAVAVAGTANLPLTLGPVVDGDLVRASPAAAMLAGAFNLNATVLVSETLFEGDSLLVGYSHANVLSPAAAAAALAQFGVQVGFPTATTAAVGAAYAAALPAQSPFNASSRLWGDGLIACAAAWAARGAAAHSLRPAYRLLFNTTLGSGQPAGRATHGTDLAVLFGGAAPAVAADVWAWLANAAVTGDPNVGPGGGGAPPAVWPPYTGPAGGALLAVTELREYSRLAQWQEELCDSLWLGILP